MRFEVKLNNDKKLEYIADILNDLLALGIITEEQCTSLYSKTCDDVKENKLKIIFEING